MNDFQSFDNDSDPEFIEIQLGDAEADDANLRAFLKHLAEQSNVDAPKTRRSDAIKLMSFLNDSLAYLGSKIFSSLSWVKDRLTNHNIRVATATKIVSEAFVNETNASNAQKMTDVKVETQQAQAEAIRSETQLKQIAFFDERGIDWYPEYDETGYLRIVVTKHPKKRKRKNS